MLFLVAGNILTAYQSKSTTEVSGVLHVLPYSGVLWIVGFFAITGSPPFGLFVSELTIVKTALDQGRVGVALTTIVFLMVIFVGMATVILRMSHGTPAAGSRQPTPRDEPLLSLLPATALAATVLLLGLYLPSFLSHALEEAAQALG